MEYRVETSYAVDDDGVVSGVAAATAAGAANDADIVANGAEDGVVFGVAAAAAVGATHGADSVANGAENGVVFGVAAAGAAGTANGAEDVVEAAHADDEDIVVSGSAAAAFGRGTLLALSGSVGLSWHQDYVKEPESTPQEHSRKK